VTLRCFILALGLAIPLLAQDVGSGSPNETIRLFFTLAYYRNGFVGLVAYPPLGDVRRFGSTGYVQEFADAARTSGVRYALIKPNDSTSIPEDAIAVFQVFPTVYSYYNSLGVNTVGYPNIDTRACPPLPVNSCLYQTFDRNYALFVYASAGNLTSATFFTRDPYFTQWTSAGGIGVLGPATSAETAFTSAGGATGTVQTYQNGAVFNITGGSLTPRIIPVKPEVWRVYAANNTYLGFLGVPLTAELRQPNGRVRQTFEGGSIEYDPTVTGSGTVRLPVASVVLAPQQGTVRLNAGDQITVSATAFGPDGSTLANRDFSWSTTNGRVAAIIGAATGPSITVRAAAGGPAQITASSEGRLSLPLSIFVTAPCCAPGEGAPTVALQQAFADALTRNRLTPRLPAAAPATRVGLGFVQEFLTTANETVLVAVSERTGAGFVLRSPLLASYRELGGPAGPLGYPTTDVTAGGRQLFEGGALVGNPPQLVTGNLLSKWAVLNYETGVAGPATAAPVPFLSFRATAGRAQSFRNAVLFEINSGTQSGRVWFVSGPALVRYLALNGPAGRLGAPTSDEIVINNQRRQEFEGGVIEYFPGQEPTVTENARQPLVTATPSFVPAGTFVRLAVGGFDAGARLRVSVAGQPDFNVESASGAFVWDVFVPANARSGPVTLRATDTRTNASAQGSYTVRATPEARLRLTIVRGDQQSAPPGALLPQPIRIRLADDAGTPVPNAPVRFAASPGAQIVNPSPVTDARGEALVWIRVPNSEGIVLATAESQGQIVTLSARASRLALTNFTRISQNSEAPIGNSQDPLSRKGALVASLASVLRYYQNRNELSSAQGLADLGSVNTYLRGYCAFDTLGGQICDGFLDVPSTGTAREQIANPWRLAGFVGGGLIVAGEPPSVERVKDLLAQGTPSVLALSLSANNAGLGSHFVTATGVNASGSLLIADPSNTNATTLDDYLNGVRLAGVTAVARLTGVLTLTPGAPPNPGFLAAANATLGLASPRGVCGTSFVFPVAPAAPDSTPRALDAFSLLGCDALDEVYHLNLQATTGAGEARAFQGWFTDLANPGNRSDLAGGGQTALRVAPRGAQWTVSPLDVAANPVAVNPASLTRDLAPGGLVLVTGSGFDRGTLTAQVNGVPAVVLSAQGFEALVQVPFEIPAGPAVLTLASEFGSADVPLALKSLAPALFGLGRIVNQSGSVNSVYTPASRGQTVVLYATGLGPAPGGRLATPVSVLIGGAPAAVSFAGLTSTPGLYQINAVIPPAIAPGLAVEAVITQGDAVSNPVPVTVQ
jgi:uncharacterized protein (TIGR03437 family)